MSVLEHDMVFLLKNMSISPAETKKMGYSLRRRLVEDEYTRLKAQANKRGASSPSPMRRTRR